MDEPSASVIGALVTEALAYHGASTNPRPSPPWASHFILCCAVFFSHHTPERFYNESSISDNVQHVGGGQGSGGPCGAVSQLTPHRAHNALPDTE